MTCRQERRERERIDMTDKEQTELAKAVSIEIFGDVQLYETMAFEVGKPMSHSGPALPCRKLDNDRAIAIIGKMREREMYADIKSPNSINDGWYVAFCHVREAYCFGAAEGDSFPVAVAHAALAAVRDKH